MSYSDAGWNLSMSFPQPGTRLIIETEDSRYPDDMCLWMLVGDEVHGDWNAWIYAFNHKEQLARFNPPHDELSVCSVA